MTLVACMVLTACGANKNEATDETGAAESAKDKVSIMLDWYPNAVHSNIYVAKEKGYFDDEGVEVEIHMPSDANDPLKLAALIKWISQVAIKHNCYYHVQRGFRFKQLHQMCNVL